MSARKSTNKAAQEKALAELASRKKTPMADLLAELQSTHKKAEAQADAGLLDLGIQIKGKPAFVRLINLEQSEALNYAGATASGELDWAKLARAKSMLISFAVVDSSGAPIFPGYKDVDLTPAAGDALWTVCSRHNRTGMFRGVDEETGEAITPGN